MDEMRQRDLPTQRAGGMPTQQGHRLVDSFLGGLVGGVAALLIARPDRLETDSPVLITTLEYEIGAGSVWGVGG